MQKIATCQAGEGDSKVYALASARNNLWPCATSMGARGCLQVPRGGAGITGYSHSCLWPRKREEEQWSGHAEGKQSQAEGTERFMMRIISPVPIVID